MESFWRARRCGDLINTMKITNTGMVASVRSVSFGLVMNMKITIATRLNSSRKMLTMPFERKSATELT